MSAETLLPCPFCGGRARTFHFNGTAQATCAGDFTECAGADGYSPVAMWNRRTPPAPMEAGPVNSTGPDTHPPQPDALPGDLRERVARIVDPEAFDHPTVHPQHLVRRRVEAKDKADAILSLIQSERGKP